MTTLRDPAAIHSQLHRKKSLQQVDRKQQQDAPRSSRLGKRASFAAFSSVVRDTVSWAGDTLNTYRDGLSKDERERKLRDDDRKQLLYLKMRNAVSFDEWRTCACDLDDLEGNNTWKETFESTEYNPTLVHERMKQLEDARISCDVPRMLFLIRTALSRDLGSMSEGSLYQHTHIGTKNLIDEYINTAVSTISSLLELSASGHCDPAEMQYILDQLLSARQAFGRSAVLLSGGGTFGMNHVGVAKALWEAKLVPRIISGASAGSIVASIYCAHTEDELPAVLEAFPYGELDVFEPEGKQLPPLQKMAQFLKHGFIYDSCHITRVMRGWLGDLTFHEAYNRTRKILNICVSSAGLYELTRLLNYITAPNVLIWSAITVSCSVPGIFSGAVLMAKDPLTGEPVPWHDRGNWIDGSVDGDLPMTRLSEMFNVNHFIVSQVNPHVVPFLAKEETLGAANRKPWLSSPWVNAATNLAREEILHRITTLSEMGIFQNVSMKTASILDQKYSGDINIFPEIPYSHFPRILQNPTTDFILETCLSGERATWPKISRVRNHLAIELALDSAVRTMRARVALSPPIAASLGAATTNRASQSQAASDEYQQEEAAQRRSSYSHESGKSRGAGRNTSHTRASVDLGAKARSSLSVGCIELSRPVSPVARQKPHRRSATSTERWGHTSTTQSANPGNNKLFTVGADSDDESAWFAGVRHSQNHNSHNNHCNNASFRLSSPRSRRTSPAASRRSSVAKMASIPSPPSQPAVKKSHSLGV